MLFRDFLRVAVMLFGGSATALAVVAWAGGSAEDTWAPLYFAVGWWAVAAIGGLWFGRGHGPTDQIGKLLAGDIEEDSDVEHLTAAGLPPGAAFVLAAVEAPEPYEQLDDELNNQLADRGCSPLLLAEGGRVFLLLAERDLPVLEAVVGDLGLWAGASAVHTHMTNSRLTDPEVLEWLYPVRVEEFRVRAGSGGAGEHRGGDGVVRRVRFLEPLTAAIVSSSRRVPPFGLAGGLPGACGRNAVERADGSVERLPGVAQTRMAPGDVLVIETPGGGGYGAPPSSP